MTQVKPGASLLTDTEIKILGLMCVGLSDEDIAAELRLGLDELEIYVDVIFNKISVSSRLQAVFWAAKHL